MLQRCIPARGVLYNRWFMVEAVALSAVDIKTHCCETTTNKLVCRTKFGRQFKPLGVTVGADIRLPAVCGVPKVFLWPETWSMGDVSPAQPTWAQSTNPPVCVLFSSHVLLFSGEQWRRRQSDRYTNSSIKFAQLRRAATVCSYTIRGVIYTNNIQTRQIDRHLRFAANNLHLILVLREANALSTDGVSVKKNNRMKCSSKLYL